MNAKIIQKTCDFIENLRHLGFDGAGWPDIMAVTGELSPADKKALGKDLINSGAWQRPDGIFSFKELELDVLASSDVDEEEEIKLVSIMFKAPGGTWGRDAEGRVRFVRDLSYVLPDINDDQDEDSGPDNDSNRGKLAIDL